MVFRVVRNGYGWGFVDGVDVVCFVVVGGGFLLVVFGMLDWCVCVLVFCVLVCVWFCCDFLDKGWVLVFVVSVVKYYLG